jgi:hypothetical protein
MRYLSKLNSYFREGFNSIEIVRLAGQMRYLIEAANVANNHADRSLDFLNRRNKELAATKDFFKNYNPKIDKEIFILLMEGCYDNVYKYFLPAENIKLLEKYKCIKQHVHTEPKPKFNEWYTYNMKPLAEQIYSKSIFLQQEKLINILESGDVKAIASLKNDVLYQLIKPIFDNYVDSVQPKLMELDSKIKSLDRLWTKALMEMQTQKTFFPDANLTLRVTYGKIDGYNPRDGVTYKHYTTVEGIMEKENPAVYDYIVEPKLKQLYANKDYGRYAMKNGEMPVAFVATNHTTGGNSGSPVLNADGHLIGINFDRCWEGTMSDIHYDPDQCRNISVDIRYCLFIMDKFAGARHLIDEMTIVE